MKDPIGQAILDYQNNIAVQDLKTFSSVAGKAIMPIEYLFRAFNEMPKLEQKALELSSGKVLDIGCGAGSHSIYLQEKGFDVTGIDISKGAIEVCKLRGLKNAVAIDFWHLKNQKFDTILLMMNGIGLCGKLYDLPKFLGHLKKLLNKGGQILVDSSDIKYMYETEAGDFDFPTDQYYGEVPFTMTYKREKSAPFNWLYLDFNTLKLHARQMGFQCQLILEGPHYDYLAKLFN
ncbi:MAG: SAM-dependent methyltransferase [Flavobacteriales bacterium CG_4_9_14_0_2_um_filter_35_242]|nr:class I SAM-dependent methyltransferase [Zetaproteobacteria bacterium]OIO10214.1 MAG: SAM-dependent methyltransferase [Flavobacteriaceae bacterium CG1_02_35_72]PIR14616.1 MAG: SAM-dependent methyltransferase [Flavobacteriales bacterium CG11_big_fil_rev_8_21_14_0_20_35_7]PIX06673.1 MAG: SAM-dependent methyltransferase [Flavobacteriales bacterium CG_4_8_14_3_um_filter_35_10]PJA06937.1 MAG: SAM-dependent methyltransferase [Flavobacteriales bacterium CG_4_10_14_0_2_um_filter_35_18]PJC59596.1 MA